MYFEVADITASIVLVTGRGLVVGLVFSTMPCSACCDWNHQRCDAPATALA
jgi:hypothetical protein